MSNTINHFISKIATLFAEPQDQIFLIEPLQIQELVTQAELELAQKYDLSDLFTKFLRIQDHIKRNHNILLSDDQILPYIQPRYPTRKFKRPPKFYNPSDY